MAISYAMLLDGGFIRRKLGTNKAPADAAAISAFAASVQKLQCLDQMRLHRIYYYDAKPLEGIAKVPLGGGDMGFGASEVAARNKSIHAGDRLGHRRQRLHSRDEIRQERGGTAFPDYACPWDQSWDA